MRAILSAALFCGVLAAGPATAQDAESAFYAGKTVRIVVGYGPGGGYDIYARTIAPYIAKNLGPNVNVIVENQPGAGGLTALNRVYAAQPDGLTMMIVNGTGAVLAQLAETPGARFDLGKVSHLGTVSVSPWVWLVGPNSPIRSAEDAMKAKQIMWSGGGPMDGLSDGAAFTCEALKLNCRIVIGYPGSNEAAIAVTKGEMDAVYVSDTSANNYVKAGNNRPVATMAREKSRFFPNVPTIFEAVKLDAEQTWIFDYRATVENLGRILIATPGLPPARLAHLQEAVKKALTDPVLVAEGERTQRYIDFVDGDTTRKAMLAAVAELTPDQKKKIVRLLTVHENK